MKTLLGRIFWYLNPVAHLGERKYSILFPFAATALTAVLLDLYLRTGSYTPQTVGGYAILIFIAMIIYFSFRDGIRGGLITSFVTIVYYFYLIYALHYTGQQFNSGVETTIILAAMYALMAWIIGWLKERIDILIDKEKDARLQAEEDKLRLETILEQLPVGVLLANDSGKHLEGNKQLEKILGNKVSSAQLNLDNEYKSKYAFKNDKSLSSKEWPIVRALVKGETVIAEEMEYARNDGKRLHIRVNAAPIKNKNKKIIAAVSTLYDVTQEKELEQRKDDFVNMASHELKTPITSMKLYLELLSRSINSTQNTKVAKILTSIKTQTERLQELVNDLLDVSRLQTGKLSFTKEKLQINELISETIEVLTPTAKQKIIFEDSPSIVVFADRFRIYQVITNLITNAIKYSDDDTTIVIRANKKGSNAVISVADKGMGIAKDQQARIFDRLYQINDATVKTFPGFGMGLYIAREIVTRHKGKIWVESEKGKGSTFFFSLPLYKKNI